MATYASARTALLLVASAGALAACATAPPMAPHPYGGVDGGGSGWSGRGGGQGRLAQGGSAGRPRAYNRPYQVHGRWYTPADQPGYDQVGLASWYGYESSSGRTSDGEVFDARLATAAHTTLPIPSWLEVTNLQNGRVARLRLNDRGPFAGGRILDVSKAAAMQLGFWGQGVTRVRVRYLGPAGAPGAPAPDPFGVQIVAIPRPRASTPPAPILTDEDDERPRDEVRQDLSASDDMEPAAEPTPEAPSATPDPAPVGDGFVVQAAAFADRGNAERARTRLEAAGAARISALARADGLTLYRVLVGPWREPEEAAEARGRVAALGFADARVVTR